MKIFTLNPNCLVTQIECNEASDLIEEANLLNEFSDEVVYLKSIQFTPSELSVQSIIEKLSTNSLETIN